MSTGRRVRAMVLAAALTGSALGAVTLGAVATAGPALAVPVGSEYPATWTVSGDVATGTTPSGVVVTATVTGPATFSTPGSGSLVLTGSTPGYFPASTTQALHLDIKDCTGPSCGSITYSFSRPVLAPVLYIGDLGAGTIGGGVFIDFHDSPVTLSSGTFSLDSAGSETPNTSIQNGGTTVALTDPAASVGTSGVDPSSCGTYGCGVYDISAPTQTVTSVTMNYGYAGSGTYENIFTQILGVTPPTPALTLQKSVSPSVAARAGTTVTFSYLVTNTGNVTLTSVHPVDTSFSGAGTPSPITCPSTTLDPGQNETCTASYPLTQADVNAGEVTNTATATGTPPGEAPVTSSPSSATVTIPATPALAIKKSTSPGSFDEAGTTIYYRYLVTNTGNVTLTGIKVDDKLAGLSAISCPSTTLNPGKDMTCTASYVTTAADLRARSIANTATVTGDPPSGSPVLSAPSTALVTAPPAALQPGTPVPVTG
jgi:uncharacterized repeat protein (TIGR01451 family)